MILKSFEERKIDLTNQKIHLLYGENQGQINDFLKDVFKKNFKDEIFTYDEVEVIKNEDLVYCFRDIKRQVPWCSCFVENNQNLFGLLMRQWSVENAQDVEEVAVIQVNNYSL